MWFTKANLQEPQNAVYITNNEFLAPIDLDQREKLKLSVKLFLCSWRPELIHQAVEKSKIITLYSYYLIVY